MSNASNIPIEEHGSCNPSSSQTKTHSNAGATTIPSGSFSPSFISRLKGAEATCGVASPNATSPTPLNASPLHELLAEHDYAARVNDVAERIGKASSHAACMSLFKYGVTMLGVDSAVFANFARGPAKLSSCRFMLACELRWCQHHVDAGFLAHDPWLAYAAHHSEPVVASRLPVTLPEHREVADWAIRCGFVSAALFPVHSGLAQGPVSLLCLGSVTPGFFEDDGFGRFKLGARLIAAELHDWWRRQLRNDALLKARLTPLEIELLRHEHQGLISKQIAAELQVSRGSVNSRFQRMNKKLGVPNRRSAVRLAVECGLLLGNWGD